MTDIVTLHGNEWKLSDIQEDVAHLRQRSWFLQYWRPTLAFVHKEVGCRSQYTGQVFDPEKVDLIEDGWTHDHCVICFFALFDSEELEENTGWADGNQNWLCSECYEKLIK